MNSDSPPSERDWSPSRRRMLATLGGAGLIGLAGCSQDGGSGDSGGDGDADGGDSSNGDSSNGNSPTGSSGGGAGGCAQWSGLTPYDVPGTNFAVVPSFPTGWTKYRDYAVDGAVEAGFGWPETGRTNSYTETARKPTTLVVG